MEGVKHPLVAFIDRYEPGAKVVQISAGPEGLSMVRASSRAGYLPNDSDDTAMVTHQLVLGQLRVAMLPDSGLSLLKKSALLRTASDKFPALANEIGELRKSLVPPKPKPTHRGRRASSARRSRRV